MPEIPKTSLIYSFYGAGFCTYPIHISNLFYFPGLANRTAEKVKPSALDMVLLFKEAVRVKRHSNPSSSLRDMLNSVIGEYNRVVATKVGDSLLPNPLAHCF